MKKNTINRKSEATTLPDYLFEVSKPEKWGSQARQFMAMLPAITALMFAGTQSSQATPPGKQTLASRDQQSVQRVVAKQAALVSEFEVNGLKVLVKRREGSLTVAASLFIRGGAANTNAENAGTEQLMLNASTEASTGFPREKMRSELSRMGTTIGT